MSRSLEPGRAVALRVVRRGRSRTYTVRCLPRDFGRFRVSRAGRPQAGWYLVTPNVFGVPGYVALFDSHGVPVWWIRRSPAPFAADLLPDGNVSWTDFVALASSTDHFEEHTLDGRLVRVYRAVGEPANQHDFALLPNGDALLITYPRRDGVDLSRWGGPSQASVLDGEIQEVDPQGHLVWAWNTKDHVALSESARWIRHQVGHPVLITPDGRPLFDLVHVNSVEPAGRRVVISARYLDAVYGIDRATGAIDWKVGGTHRRESLKIRGDRLARRDFGGQHDARLARGGRVLTVFDNGTLRHRPPRALAFRLHLKRRRANLMSAVRFPRAGYSKAAGSARLLPGGDWVVAWGNTPWVTELTPTGRLVLGIDFIGRKGSYRAIPVMPGQLTRRSLRRAMDRIYPP